MPNEIKIETAGKYWVEARKMVSGEWINGNVNWDGLSDILVVTTYSGRTKYIRHDEITRAFAG